MIQKPSKTIQNHLKPVYQPVFDPTSTVLSPRPTFNFLSGVAQVDALKRSVENLTQDVKDLQDGKIKTRACHDTEIGFPT